MMDIPRPEHPKPQFQRESWLNLNGWWSYEFDFGKSGVDRRLFESKGFADRIRVPFCPESELSGVGHKDFIEMMWYHRELVIPADWNQRVLLHFGAVDYECEVFIDGQSAGRHYGGGSSFCFDITDLTIPGGVHHLVVMVEDNLRSWTQTGGKQSTAFGSVGCHYTRTTGIWQTVWMEHVSACGLKQCRITPDFDSGSFDFMPEFHAVDQSLRFQVSVLDRGAVVASADVPMADGVTTKVSLDNPRAWSPESPFLYDVVFEVKTAEGQVLDTVASYAGLRKIHIEDGRVFLNNAPFYQRLVLDQGFYADGIWTAPTDQALKNDILLGQQAGFNGARLHQKVFEERFHYWADKLGYVTWAEVADWNLNFCYTVIGREVNVYKSMANYSHEWREIVLRDRNHPSIIAWTPFNETGNGGSTIDWTLHRRFLHEIVDLTRSLDPTRPINDASGGTHEKTDFYTIHNYVQDPEKLKAALALNPDRTVGDRNPKRGVPHRGEPLLLDEFGGIKWIPEVRRESIDNTWGYGEGPKSLDEYYRRLAGLVKAVEDSDHVCGFCYTQLTDVEQETNGIYNYDRSEKFDLDKLKRIIGNG